MQFYARRHAWMFVAMTPGVVGSLLILTPFAVAGLVLIVPGISGLLGLVGLTLAWLSLMWPRIAARRRGLIVGFLLCSWPATLMGWSILGVKVQPYQSHSVDWMRGAGWASVGFGLLSLFFIVALLSDQTSSSLASSERVTRLWTSAGTLFAIIGMVVPTGYVLALSGYGSRIRAQQGEQATHLALATLHAVNDYRGSHQNAFPPDNRSAGLASPEAIQDRYVQSVRIDHGVVTLKYREDIVATLFGAGASDVILTFTPAEKLGKHVLQQDGALWSCKSQGYRVESDLPLLLDGRCGIAALLNDD